MEKLTDEQLKYLEESGSCYDDPLDSLIAEVREGRRVVEIGKDQYSETFYPTCEVFVCPNCKGDNIFHREVSDDRFKHCPDCGIALKWKD